MTQTYITVTALSVSSSSNQWLANFCKYVLYVSNRKSTKLSFM